MQNVIRILTGFVLCAAIAGAVEAQMITRQDLSLEAQQLLPAEETTVVQLKNGDTQEGILIGKTDTEVVLRVTKRGIISNMSFPAEDVSYVGARDITEDWARVLLEIRLNPEGMLRKSEYVEKIALLSEFINRCPNHRDTKAIEIRRRDFQEELDALNAGLEKVDGKLLDKVMAVMQAYEIDVQKAKRMEKEYPGIQKPTYVNKKDPEARKHYEAILTRRKEAVRQMPQLVRLSIPRHLNRKKWKTAVEELDRFQRIWINLVIPEEANQGTLVGLDISFIFGLQKQVMKAYLEGDRASGSPPRGIYLPKDMVFVPAGYFLMGRASAGMKDDEFPMHIVFTDSYFIDRYEVRNKDYRKFVEYVKRTGDASIEHPSCPPMKDHTPECWAVASLSGDNQPVVGVDWFDAYAYAKWEEKRLPTEAEWERAARGQKMFMYPWGEEPPNGKILNYPAGRAALAGQMNRLCPRQPVRKGGWLSCIRVGKRKPPPAWELPTTTWDVDRLIAQEAVEEEARRIEGSPALEWKDVVVSPYDVFHMAGNAAEWINDWYDPQYYRTSPIYVPKGPEEGSVHGLRGGSYLSSDVEELKTTWRGSQNKKGSKSSKQPFIGFRCAKSLAEVKKRF